MSKQLTCEEVKVSGLKCDYKAKFTRGDGKHMSETKSETKSKSIDDYINTDLLPSCVEDNPWLYERKTSTCGYDTGKWMLFYPLKFMDEKWILAKKLYRENRLVGVSSIKCSTLFKNPRASSLSGMIIIIYCNESSNEEKILNIGRKLLDLFNYTEQQVIYYKTDLQSNQGTFATGNFKNHEYKLFNHLYKHKRLL